MNDLIRTTKDESGVALLYVIAAGLAVSIVLAMVPARFSMAQKKLYEKETLARLTNKSQEIRMTLKVATACERVLGAVLYLSNNQAVYSGKHNLTDLVTENGSLTTTSASASTAAGSSGTGGSGISVGGTVTNPLPADQISLGQPLFSGAKTYLAKFKIPVGFNEYPSPHPEYFELPVYLVFNATNNLSQCQGTQISLVDQLSTENRICKMLMPGTIYDPQEQMCKSPT